MTHNKQNISGVHSGDAFEVKNTSTVDTNGDPVDITGANIDWYLKDDGAADIDAHISKDSYTTGGGITIDDAVSGAFTVKVDTAETDGLAGEYAHVVRMDIGGDLITTLTGTVVLEDF